MAHFGTRETSAQSLRAESRPQAAAHRPLTESRLPCNQRRWAAAALAALTLVPLPALAADPFCAVAETCTITAENCQPAEGRIEIAMQAGGKAQVHLDGVVMGEATPLALNNVMALIFTTEDGTQNQLRIQDNGAFNYLVSTPDASEFNGKRQILYRGQCQEGS